MDNKDLIIQMTTPEDDERPVYIAGNFNNWAAMDRTFKMEKVKKGEYLFRFPEQVPLPELLQFKFTKGDWSAVEIDQNAERTPNRQIRKTQLPHKEVVYKWRRNWLPFKHQLLPVIELVSDHFEMPQLQKTRKVWILLPHDYYHSSRRYPVLYLQDAQNLFNDHAPFGSWEIDKKLAVMSEYHIGDMIIVAIEHAESDRLKEYVVGHTSLGQGQGKAYVDFVTETLLPHINSHYRTLTGREHTGIGGSSLGALISLFAGLNCPHYFGKLMIFSPSLWVTPHLNIPYSWLTSTESDTRLYFYAGKHESSNMVPDINNLRERIEKSQIYLSGRLHIQVSLSDKGTHQEKFWGNEFPKAIEWLFFRDEST